MKRYLPYRITECYLTSDQLNAPAITPAGQAGTRFTYPVEIKG